MQICFGETLRRLRREKSLTQEQLATRLNVSFQTISNWERDESWPDISMLPVLAGFFGVKTDDLLGLDQSENELRITELITRYMTNQMDWTPGMEAKAFVAPVREMLKEFPDEWRLWGLYFGLMTSLCPDDTAERVRERLPEVRRIYENILENCTNDAIRIEAKTTMCHFLIRIVERDPGNCEAESAEIKHIISELPTLLDTREYISTMFLPGTILERITACQSAISDALGMLDGMLTHLCNHIEGDDPKHLMALRVKAAMYDAIYPDGDYGKNSGWVINLWEFITLWYAKAGEFDEAFAAMRRCVEIVRRFEALPPTSEHTSPLLEGLTFDKAPHFYAGGIVQWTRKAFTVGEEEELYELFSWPAAFRADPRFGEILAQLDE